MDPLYPDPKKGVTMKRNSIYGIVFFTLMPFMIFAGGDKEKEAATVPAKQVEITFASQPTPSMDYLIGMIPQFEKTTGIKVKSDLMPYDNLVQKVTIDCTTNTKQYGCFWMEPTWLGRFENEFEPLGKYINDPILGKDFNINDFSKSFLDEVVCINGKMIGIPFEGCLMLLAYREDVYKKNNIQIPKTWEEYLQTAKKLNTKDGMNAVTIMGKRGQPIFYEFMPYLYGFGGNFFDKNMKPIINSKEAVEALEYLIELSKYAPPGFPSYGWEESATAFMQGKVTSGLLFSDWIPSLKDPNSSKVTGNWNFARVPAGKAGVGSPAGTINLGINADCDQETKNASFLFIKWATSKEVQTQLAKIGSSPTRLSVLDSSEFTTNPEYRYFKALKETYDITKTPMKIPEFFELNDALSIELSAAVVGQKTAKQALDAAQESWSKIMAESGY